MKRAGLEAEEAFRQARCAGRARRRSAGSVLLMTPMVKSCSALIASICRQIPRRCVLRRADRARSCVEADELPSLRAESGRSPSRPLLSKNWPQRGHWNWALEAGASASGSMSAVTSALSKPAQADIIVCAGEDAAAEDVALGRARVDLDADMEEVLLDQVEDVGLLGALAGRLD